LAGESSGESVEEEISRNGACVKPPGSVRLGATSICRTSLLWFDTNSSTSVCGSFPSCATTCGSSSDDHLSWPVSTYTDCSNVVVDGDAGEALGEDAAAPLVGLAEEDVLDPGALESEIESSDSREC
jgi:hypothetical protein